MRTLVIVAASILLSAPALACEMDKAAKSPPDASIASSKDAAAPAPVAKQPQTAPTVASQKQAKEPVATTSTAPQPVYFSQRAAK